MVSKLSNYKTAIYAFLSFFLLSTVRCGKNVKYFSSFQKKKKFFFFFFSRDSIGTHKTGDFAASLVLLALLVVREEQLGHGGH